MEKEKKKYVKPLLRVAEWDFNEAVCDDGIMVISTCLNVRVTGNGGIDAIDNRGEYTTGDENSWSKWPSSNNY